MDPLGVDALPKSAFTATSSATNNEPWRAKFGGASTDFWCPSSSSTTEYIEIDLGVKYIISGIALEGDYVGNNWIEDFNVVYKEDDTSAWKEYAEYLQSGLTAVRFTFHHCI